MSPSYRSTPLQILLIEDDATINSVLKVYVDLYFKTENVTLVSSLREGLAYLKTIQVDLVLTDFYFSDGNAIPIINRVNELNPKPKLVITSGMRDPSATLQGLVFDDFIPKPYNLDQVAEVMSRMLNVQVVCAETSEA